WTRVLVARSLPASQCKLCPLPALKPVCKAVHPAIDALSQCDEVASISQLIATTICPPPGRSPSSELRPLQQLGPVHAVDAQGAGHCFIIRPPGDLDQPPAPVPAAVSRLRVAQVLPALVALLCLCRAPDLAGVRKPSRFMAELGEEGGQSHRGGDIELDARSPD